MLGRGVENRSGTSYSGNRKDSKVPQDIDSSSVNQHKPPNKDPHLHSNQQNEVKKEKKSGKNFLRPFVSFFKSVLPSHQMNNNKVFNKISLTDNSYKVTNNPLNNNLYHQLFSEEDSCVNRAYSNHSKQHHLYINNDGATDIDATTDAYNLSVQQFNNAHDSVDDNNNRKFVGNKNDLAKAGYCGQHIKQDDREMTKGAEVDDDDDILRKKPHTKMAYTYHGRQNKMRSHMGPIEGERVVKEITVTKSGKITKKNSQGFLLDKFGKGGTSGVAGLVGGRQETNKYKRSADVPEALVSHNQNGNYSSKGTEPHRNYQAENTANKPRHNNKNKNNTHTTTASATTFTTTTNNNNNNNNSEIIDDDQNNSSNDWDDELISGRPGLTKRPSDLNLSIPRPSLKHRQTSYNNLFTLPNNHTLPIKI